MKALRKVRPERGAQIESVPVPQPGPVDVLVRVRAASICGTDLHIYGWDRWSASRIKPPMTFGHEFCGFVEAVGTEVTSVRPGDFVSAEMHINCGHCRPCRMGQPHVCQNVKIIGIDADGQTLGRGARRAPSREQTRRDTQHNTTWIHGRPRY